MNDDRMLMTTTTFLRASATILSVCLAAACTPRRSPAPAPVPTPGAPAGQPAPGAPVIVPKAPVPEVNPALPPVPHVTGPLAIKVVYPSAGATIQSKDSNFVFGSVGNGDAAVTVNGVPAPVWPNGAFMAWLANPPADVSRYDIIAATATDTTRLSVPVKIQPAATNATPVNDTIQPLIPARYGSLVGPAAYASDTDRVITGYALAGGIQRWFLMPNTVVKITGTKGNDVYVQLDSMQTIRIDKGDVKLLDTTYAAGPLKAAAFRVQESPEWTDIVIPVTARPAYLVDEAPSSMTLILYNTSGPSVRQLPVKPSPTSYINTVTPTSDATQMRYTLDLKGPIYGYQPLWQDSVLTFRVRRVPQIDAASPLRGLTIAIDPGHPPIGATGPTGLWEPIATLPVGLKAQELLRAKGANVLMTRTTPDPVDLYLRPAMARRANANAFVSIHLNAVPDGQNPFRAQGTTTYHYYVHSEPLADSVHRAVVSHLSLRDIGVKRENFAVIRGTWMPSVLVEGAFIIMPDQEAALRTPEYQLRYAQGIVDGLENYFRALGQQIKH